MNRPNVLDGVNRSRNMMLKDRSYASKPSPMDKPLPQRTNVGSGDATFACIQMNSSNYNNPFMPILPRISEPPPMPVQPSERQKSLP